MNFYPIGNDDRYSICKEYTGHPSARPQFVIRFCGEWVGSSQFYDSAVVRAVGHNAVRIGTPIITEIAPILEGGSQ